jgi:hypothetical protein
VSTALTRALAAATAIALLIASLSDDPLREYAATGAYAGFSATALAALIAAALRPRRGVRAARLRRGRRVHHV